jgi:signal peptidase II
MTTDSIVHPSVSLRIYGLGLALAWFVLDQVMKWWMLEGVLASQVAIQITPFFNLVLGWNRGVSFGILGGHDLPSWMLALLSGSIAAGLMIWMLRTNNRLSATGLALIIGGALGNALDRVRHGAVTDFLDFHVFGWHWPAFNMADVGIVCGAAVLTLDSFVPRGRRGADNSTTGNRAT